MAGMPTLHFLLLGGLLFTVQQLWLDSPQPIHVRLSAADIRGIDAGFRQQMGRDPDPPEQAALIQAEIDDRVLLEEAFARGWQHSDAIAQRRLIRNQRFLAPDDEVSDRELLERAYAQGMDRSDIVVRRRLLERARLATHATAREPAPTRAELTAYLETHTDRFRRPERVRLSHVFLSRDRRGGTLAEDAATLGAQLTKGAIAPDEARRLSDPFLLRTDLPLWSEASIARQLGTKFAAAAIGAPIGKWSGPIESTYGLHYVYVHEYTPALVPTLDEVETKVRGELLHEREELAMRRHIARLRSRASVSIERPRS